jgi:hypothetical protein
MKFRRLYKRLLSTFAAAMLLAGASGTAMAAASGTAADTTISNSATVNYKVNAIDQAAVNSNTADFLVDRHVDFTVVTDELAALSVTTNTTENVLTFTVDNTGNDTFDFNLAAVDLNGAAAQFGGTDNNNATGTAVYVDANANGTYEAATDLATSIDDLAAGGAVKVFIVASFGSAGFSNGDIASYYLRATALDSAGGVLSDHAGDADVAGTVQNVFATDLGPAPTDLNLDQIDSDYADYVVSAASLTVTKSSAVIWDPVNLFVNPKAIPQAVIEYTVTITKDAGAGTATDITVSDSLDTEITNGTIAFKTDGYPGGGMQVTAPKINGGAAKDLTNASDADEGEWNAGTNTVTVTGISLAASESATVKLRVTVQ